MLGFNIFVLVLLVLFIAVLAAGVKVVPQGWNYTVERFGRYTRTLRPGLTLIIPFIDRIGRKLNVMEQVIEVPSQEVITKDNAVVRVDGVAVRGCCLLAVQADGCVVETVESLAGEMRLSPLQESFKRHHALQCGFCRWSAGS